MADINQFIGELGEDASARYVPTVQSFIHDVGQKIAQDAGPKVGAFVETLVKDIVAQQSGPIQVFLTELIKDVAARYRPEVQGNLTTRIVEDGIEIESKDTRLNIKDPTGNSITSLDIPVLVKIHVDELFLRLDGKTVINDPQLGGF